MLAYESGKHYEKALNQAVLAKDFDKVKHYLKLLNYDSAKK